MLNIRNVLVPTDYSETARRAFDHARFAARQFGAKVHVVHVIDSVEPVENPNLIDNGAALDQSVVQAAIYAGEPVADDAAIDFSGSTTPSAGNETVVQDDVVFVRRTAPSTAQGILDYADEIDADLIVMGTRGRSGPRRLFMGSLAEEVVHGAKCPVLTVRAGSPTVPGRGVSRILVPVDFSGVSEPQILHAQELAATYQAELDILHIVELPQASSVYWTVESNASVPECVSRARQALVDLAAQGRTDVPTRFHVLVGHPAIDILDFAEEQGSDLILVATHTPAGGRHMMLGSVAEQVIRRAPLLVATMKASGKSLIEAPPPPVNRRASISAPTAAG